MKTLDCVKPGAGYGQVRLVVDLTIAGNPEAVLRTLADLGYRVTFQHLALPTGVHVIAVLRDEQVKVSEIGVCIARDELVKEWEKVRFFIKPEAVHLWQSSVPF